MKNAMQLKALIKNIAKDITWADVIKAVRSVSDLIS